MANFTFNIAKGRVAELARLAGANDALVAVVLETAGLETDAALMDYDTLAQVLAGATNEQTAMGRKVLASVTVNVDDTNNRQEVDCADIVWSSATGNPFSKLIICYDPDTTGGTDADLIPLTAHDWSGTPVGTDITAQINVAGFARAS